MMFRSRPTIRKTLLSAVALSCLALSPLKAAHAEPLALDKVLEQTYMENPAIKSEREALAAIDERVAIAMSEWRPKANVVYSKGRQETTFGTGPTNTNDSETKQLVVEQPLFDGFGSVARLKGSKFQVQAGRAQLLSVTQDTLLQAVTAHMDVIRDTEVLELSQNNVGVLGEQRKASQDRFDVGEITRTDVAQSEARLSRASAEATQSEALLASSQAIFRRVVGKEPVELVRPRELPVLPATLEEATKIALENNPFLKRATFNEKSLNEQVYSNKSKLLPSVALRGIMSREEGAGVTGDGDFDRDSLTVNMNVPLYQSGAEYAQVRQAKKNREEAKFEAMDVHNAVIQDVTSAWENLESSRITIRANRDAIEAANIALDGVKQEQQYGARTVLDVLDAEQELFTAKVNLVRSQRNKIVAAYTLMTAMGWLTPERLGLDVPIYNPEEHYDRVKFKPIGF